MNILHLDSSILGAQSVSRQLSQQVVTRLTQDHANAKVVYRDLVANPINHLDLGALSASQMPADQLSAEQQTQRALTETLLDELFAADVIVIGMPFYNFGMPSQLKTWIDHITVAGRTFSYTESGPIGLVTGKKVILVSSRGGVYSNSQTPGLDYHESHLHAVFSLLGLDNITNIRAEGLKMGDDFKDKALTSASEKIDQLSLAAV